MRMTLKDVALSGSEVEPFLTSGHWVTSNDRRIQELARTLRSESGDDEAFAETAFIWVRDQIGHSFDVQDARVTITTTEVLAERVGL